MNKNIVSVGVALLVIFASLYFFYPEKNVPIIVEASTQIKPTEKVLVLNRSIKAGDFLELQDFGWSNWDETMGQPSSDYFLKSNAELDEVKGAISRQSLAAGIALTKDAVIQFGEAEFLAAVLGRGMRAYTIEVDTITGGVGLIRPGNRVDVIMETKIGKDGRRNTGVPTAQTILSNVVVIAVNKELGNNMGESQDDKRKNETVTLEVNPKQVEVLTVGRSAGTLSLSLVNIHEQSGLATIPERSQTTVLEVLGGNGAGPATAVVTYYGSEKQ